jgi:membrane dipeptidase
VTAPTPVDLLAQAAEPPSEAPELDLPAVEDAAVHRSAIVVDLHVDTLWQMHSKRRRPGHPALEAGPARLAEGGVDIQFFSVWVPPDKPRPRQTAMRLINLFEATVLGRGGRVLAKTAAEAVQFARQGKKVALLGLEGAAALEGDPAAVDAFHARGVRYVALTWNERNRFGSGSKQLTGGVTPLGLKLVARLDELRVLIDVSHANPATFWGVLTHSTRPVMASHSNAWAVHPHPRNLNDLQLFALVDSGGVVGLNFHARFITSGPATLADVLRHARHLRAVGGPSLPALGTDFDGEIKVPRGLRHMGELPALSDALVAEGWPADDIAGLLGHNLLRAMHRVETGASARRVAHQPAAFSNVTSTALGTGASEAFDTVVTTGWSAPPGEATGHALTATVIGPDVDRVSICASTVTRRSGVRLVEIRARDDGGKMLHTARLPLTSEVRMHRLALPDLGHAGVIHVDVELVEVEGGPPLLAEVVFERRARAALPR